MSRPEIDGHPSQETIMKSARLATPAPEDEPGFVVLAQGPVLNAEPAGPCPRCSRLKKKPYCDCHRLKELCTLFNAAMIPAFYIASPPGPATCSRPLSLLATTLVEGRSLRPIYPSHLLAQPPSALSKNGLAIIALHAWPRCASGSPLTALIGDAHHIPAPGQPSRTKREREITPAHCLALSTPR